MIILFKNIIFDLDGVIINSRGVRAEALRVSYESVFGKGELPPYDDFFKHSGDSLKNIFAKLNFPESMLSIYQKVSYENLNQINIHEGIVELLHLINSKGYNCALCTGRERCRTDEFLGKFNIAHLFKIIVCSDDVRTPKPHPEGLFLVIEKLHVLKNDTVMIGDATNDILAAKNAEIKSIAVTWGDTESDELAKANPDFIVDSVQQFL